MIFGPTPLSEAKGAILAHTHKGASVIKKGTRLTADDVAALADEGVGCVIVARLEPGDVHEDEAAAQIADHVTGEGVRAEPAHTGRANLFADVSGLFTLPEPAIHALNGSNPAITLATLAPHTRVIPGQMVATVKIIPFAVPSAAVDAVATEAARAALAVAPWTLQTVAAISTELPALKASVIEKTLDIFARRIAASGATVIADERAAHDGGALAECIVRQDADLIVIFGASAMVDPADVIPHAIEQAGGQVIHAGMPVDPGNLLVLGTLHGRPVIGAPGCARSPKPNGFDFVLDRALCALPITPTDIARMGVGGLLTEPAVRPSPRRHKRPLTVPRNPAAVVLAAGRSSRMGPTNKLLEPVDGTPMVRRVAQAALRSRAAEVIVVTGHQSDEVRAVLDGLPVTAIYNPDYATGLSSSLRAGLNALAAEADAALVLLGDMPLVSAAHCNALLDALSADTLIAIATQNGVRGNPVAWSSALFSELRATTGDAGGRALLSTHADATAMVEVGPAARSDADTPTALAAVREAALAAAQGLDEVAHAKSSEKFAGDREGQEGTDDNDR
ncbi:MAG: molybdopterin-binding/glycosyltransferase family 2 protein [Pseudomonadota bacterium]